MLFHRDTFQLDSHTGTPFRGFFAGVEEVTSTGLGCDLLDAGRAVHRSILAYKVDDKYSRPILGGRKSTNNNDNHESDWTIEYLPLFKEK